MRSSRGDKHVKLHLLGPSTAETNWLASFDLYGNFYDRGKKIQDAEMVRDFHVSLSQFNLKKSAIYDLACDLEEWLHSKLEFERTLTPDTIGDQLLKIGIGKNSNLICSIDKPVFTLEYVCGESLSTRTSFVVDQTNIQEWLYGSTTAE